MRDDLVLRPHQIGAAVPVVVGVDVLPQHVLGKISKVSGRFFFTGGWPGCVYHAVQLMDAFQDRHVSASASLRKPRGILGRIHLLAKARVEAEWADCS